MTIASQTSRISYNGDGSTTAFAVPFLFQINADLAVYLRDAGGNATLQLLGTNYTLSGAGVSAGGTCTFLTAPASGYSVVIYRDPPITQTTSFNNNDPFPAKSVETLMDRGIAIDQRTRDIASRSVHLSDADAVASMTLPTLEARKGRVAGYDPVAGLPAVANNTLETLDSVLSGALATSGGLNRVVIVSSYAALRAMTPFAGAVVYMQGYYGQGTPGGGIFNWDASSTITHDGGIYIQPSAGGVGRWVRQLLENKVDQYLFGAVDDHATDCRAAFQAAIDYAEANDASIEWAPGWHNVQEAPASAGYCLKVNRAIKMTGAGFARTFIDPAGVAATVDVILVQYAAVGLGLTDGIHFADFWIGTPSATNRAGRHGINIDCTAVGAYVARSVIERLYINQNLNGGVGILINNNATNNVNGGYTTSTIRNCLIGNGIRGLQIGDSVNFQELTILGPGNGIDITQVTNAGSMVIARNNITSDGGAIVIHQARNPKILYNNIENFTGAGSTGAIVDIDITGLSSGLLEFKGNNIALLPGTTATTCLRLSGTTLADVDTNTFGSGGLASVTAIKIEASAAITTVGQSNIFHPGFTTLVNDLGAGTRGVKQSLTLGSGVTDIGSGYAASNYFISPDGEVAIELNINCTSPNGAIIATLPAEARPADIRRATVHNNNGTGTLSPGGIEVNNFGNIIFRGATDTTQIFGSLRYQLPYEVISV